MIVAVDKIELP